MEDARIREFEEGLWTGDADHYRELIDDECLMALPHPPYLFTGAEAIEAVANTPRWTSIELGDLKIARPQEGLIVIAYHAKAAKDDGEAYEAHCTTTMRWLDHGVWRVVQHQQTPPLAMPAKATQAS